MHDLTLRSKLAPCTLSPLAPRRCKFAIGSLSIFEEKLEQAQKELGRSPDEFLPVR